MTIEIPVWLVWVIVLLLGIPVVAFVSASIVLGAYLLWHGKDLFGLRM